MSTNFTDSEGKVLTNEDGEVIISVGATVPTGAGYAKGAIHIDDDDAQINVNRGDATTAAFNENAGQRVARVEVTNAEIKAIRATPKVLIAAPGAGKLVVVESLTLQLNYGGTNVFTESADNLVLQYTGSGTDITGAIESTGLIDQAADTAAVYYPAAIAAMATATVGVNESVELFNTGDGEIAGNAGADNTLNVVISYRVVSMV